MTRRRTSELLTELKQTRPFRSPRVEAEASILRVADRMRGYFNRFLEPHGITFQQYNVLRILRGAGRPGLPTLEIAARMIEETPGITRLIDRLERKALLRRIRQKSDRRVVTCTISDRGLELLKRLDEPEFEASEKALACLRNRELMSLIHALDKVRSVLDAQRKQQSEGNHR